MFQNWRQKRAKKRATRPRPTRTSTVLAQIEELESRWLFATAIWSGNGANANWTTGANWVGGTAPVAGDDLIFPTAALRLTNTNDFTAGTAFNSITVAANGYILGGNTIQLGVGGISQTSGDFFLGSSINTNLVLPGPRTVTVTVGQLVLGGALQGAGGLVKEGFSSLVLAGSLTNTYTGQTVVNNGTLSLAKPPDVIAVPGALVVGDGANFARAEVREAEQINDSASVTIRNQGVLDFYSSSFTETIGSLTMTGGAVARAFSGVLRLNGDVQASRDGFAVPSIQGELSLGAASRTFRTTSLDGGTDLVLNARISGEAGAGLIKTGPGTLTFGGFADNTYTGTTRVNEGTLSLGGFGIGRAIPGPLVIGDGVGEPGEDRVQIGRNDVIADNAAVTINSSGSLEFQGMYSSTFSDTIGSLTMTGGSVNTRDGTLRLNGNVTATASGGQAASIRGNLSLGSATRTFNVTSAVFPEVDLTLAATVSGEGAAGITKTGPGTMAMTGSSSNTYAGTTLVRDGILELSKSSGATAIPGPLVTDNIVILTTGNQIADESPVSISMGGVLGLLNMNGPTFSDTIGSLTLTGGLVETTRHTLRLAGDVTTHPARGQAAILGNLDLGGADRTFTIGRGQGIIDVTVAAVISGNNGLIKDGPGVLALTGTNTLQGVTSVSAGTLLVNGVHTTSITAVGRGGVLGGTGTLGTFSVQGVVNPGLNGPGILRTGSGSFNGGVLRVELNGTTPGTGHDQINTISNINGGGGRLEVALNFAAPQGSRFRIIQTNGATPQPFDGLPNNAVFAVNGQALTIRYDSQGVELVRVQATTTTTVASLDNPSVYGQPITFTAQVSSNVAGTVQPRGVVQFRDGITVLGSVPVNAAGEATFTTRTPLPVGTRTITARYQGSTDFEASGSAPINQVIQQAATITAAPISFANPSVFGQAVSFLAIINVVPPGAGLPTGTVTFLADGNVLGTAPVVGGFAVFTTADLPVGGYSISAEYSGDENFTGGMSEATFQVVNQASTRTILLSSENPSRVGQRVTFTSLTTAAAPGAGTPSGTVTFYDGGKMLAVVDIDANGVASFQTDSLAEGEHFIFAVYDGDANFAASFGFVIQTVVPTSGPGSGNGGDVVTPLQRRATPTPLAGETAAQGVLERLAVRYYQTNLGRDPEPVEIVEWVEQLRRGDVEEDALAELLGLGEDIVLK